MIYGLLFMIVGSIFCTLAPNIWVLILGRFIEGIGAGSGAAVFRAILRDVFHGDELSQKGSYIAVGTAFAMSLAPSNWWLHSILFRVAF